MGVLMKTIFMKPNFMRSILLSPNSSTSKSYLGQNKSFALKMTLIFISLLSFQFSNAQEGSAKAFVTLSPAGDFVAQMKTKGSAQLSGTKISAKNITIDLKGLTTGLELRDDHAKNKYLEVSKFPEAVLKEATGENGQGEAIINFHGKDGTVKGTYKIENNKIVNAEFTLKLSEFNINDISYKGIGVDDSVKIQVQIPIVATDKADPKRVESKSSKPKKK